MGVYILLGKSVLFDGKSSVNANEFISGVEFEISQIRSRFKEKLTDISQRWEGHGNDKKYVVYALQRVDLDLEDNIINC